MISERNKLRAKIDLYCCDYKKCIALAECISTYKKKEIIIKMHIKCSKKQIKGFIRNNHSPYNYVGCMTHKEHFVRFNYLFRCTQQILIVNFISFRGRIRTILLFGGYITWFSPPRRKKEIGLTRRIYWVLVISPLKFDEAIYCDAVVYLFLAGFTSGPMFHENVHNFRVP